MIEEYEGVREHRGPKTPFKIILSIVIILFFLSGYSLMKTEYAPTGYVISGINTLNFVGWLLIVISLILVVFLLKKPKKSNF